MALAKIFFRRLKARDDRDVIFHVAHCLGLHEAFPWPNRHAYLNWLLKGTGMSFEQFLEKVY